MSPHQGNSESKTCNACHIPHTAVTRENILRDRGGLPAESSTCFYCHDGTGALGNVKTGTDSFSGTSGHKLEDVTDEVTPRDLTNSCSGCHIPHGDPVARPKLPGPTVNGVSIAGTGNDWCLACHNDSNDWYALLGTYPALSAPSRDATGYPVAGTFGGPTLYNNATANAHVGIPADAEPGRQAGDCLYCHTAHRGPSAYDGLDGQYRPSTAGTEGTDRSNGTYAELCFQCHGGDAAWLARGATDIKQFVTHEAADTGLMASGGHRIKSAGGTLPVNSPLPCYNCHNPHGSSRGNDFMLSDELGGSLDTDLPVNPGAGVRKFCLTCHVTSDLKGWDSTSGLYADMTASTARVEGLLRNGGANGSGPGGVGYNWLRLKVTPGHASADPNSCYECHGNDYGAVNSNNVHDPGSYSVALHTGTPTASTITIKGVTYGPYACATCHNVELGPEHDKARSSSNGTDCATCHPVPRSSLVPSWNRNTCVQGNCHAGTSPDPMHSTINADHTTAGPCSSVNCHSTDAAAIHQAAGGPSCPACHGPGITPTLSCGACHPSPHPNTALAPVVNHGPSGDQCGSCHSTGNIMDVHGDNCARCHPTPAGPTAVYAGGCDQAGCHPGIHSGDHASQDHGDGSDCGSCHDQGESACQGCHTGRDSGAPITTSDARATYTSVAYVALTAVDQGFSGVKATYYQVDGGALQTGNTILVPGPAVGSRSHSIEFWSVDNQYNVETHRIAYFTISASTVPDTNAPAGTMSVNGGAAWTNTTAATLNSAVVDGETSVVTMRVDPGTGVFGAWVPYVTSYPITLPAGAGLKTVRAEYKDYAGNPVTLTDTISIETTPPSGTMQINDGSGYSKNLVVTVNSAMTDAQSGMAYMRVQWGPWIPYSATATHTLLNWVGSNQWVYVEYADAAWNVTNRSVYVMYDPLAPTGTMTINNGATYAESQSVTMNSAVTDTGGSNMYQMRVDPGTGTYGAWVAYGASYALTLPAGDGPKTVRAEYTDRAGNVLSKTYSITLGAGSDAVPPTGSIAINGTALITTNPTVTLTLSATDTGGSGLANMRFSNDNTNWTAWETYATSRSWTLAVGDGSKNVYVQYSDYEGNISTSALDTIWLDTNPPTGTVSISGGAAYTNTVNVVLTCPATDAAGGAPGAMSMRFSNNGGVSWSGWTAYWPTINWTFAAGQGTKTVTAQYRDYAGNVSTGTINDSIIYDNTAPTGSIVINGGAATTNTTAVTLTLAAADTGGSNISQMRFSNDNTNWSTWETFATAKDWTLASGDGNKSVYVQYRDGATNPSSTYVDSITLSTVVPDTTPPTGSIVINGGAPTTSATSVTLAMSASDTGGSGLAQMRLSNDNTNWTSWETYATSKAWTLTAGAGEKSVYVQYRDNATNVSVSYSDTITLVPAGTGEGVTSLVIDSGTWVDAYVGATGAWGTYEIYVNDVLIDTKPVGADTTWACPPISMPAGGHIDIVVDCGFTAYDGLWDESRPHTYTLTLPAGATGLKAATWTGFSTLRVVTEWYDGYDDDYTGVSVSACEIGNIVYTTPGDPDTTPPTGSVTVNGGNTYSSSQTVTLALPATDTGGSGLAQMRFSNDNTNWSAWEPYAASRVWTLSAGNGAKTVYVQYNDNAGNPSSTYADGIHFDGTLPTGTIIINSGMASTIDSNVTLTLSASDVGGSNLDLMRFSNDNTNWSAWQAYGTTKAWTLAAGTGARTVYVQYSDGAGNLSTVSTDSITVLASFTATYTAGSNGTISGVSPQTVAQGSSCTQVTAVPNPGYRFLAWSDGVMTPSRTDVNVQNDISPTAWFAANGTYTVTFLSDGMGWISGQWIQGVAPGGSAAAVTGVANYWDWGLEYWSSGASVSYDNPLSITNVTSDVTWTAHFVYTGSCPFLYTWDGMKYAFEADEFAAGYLGLRTSKGYRRPNPIDYHVTAHEPVAKDGALEYKLVEEREETDYLDMTKLYTVEAPANRDIYVERSQAEGVGQFTTLEAVIHTTAKNLQPPPSVTHVNTGEDVRDKVAESDGEYAILNYNRNTGFNYQTLELDLGDVNDAPMVKLVIDGRTMIPTSPEGRAYSRLFGPQAKFEVQDAAGNWVAVPSTTAILPKPPEFTRPFVLNLTNVWISDSRKVRITYLYKTYIDAILLDTTADAPVSVTELPLESADLAPHGFNFKSGVGELYDYVYGDPFSPPRYKLPGYYTKFGDVTPLLTTIDDKFVIFGGGDELTMRFAQPGPLPENATRRFLFFSNGYYKTLKEDIPHTVDPLPFATMSNYPYPASEQYPLDEEHTLYRLEWNTRYESD